MSAVASTIYPEVFDERTPAALSAIHRAEQELANLYGYAGRLHQANIAHEPHSCVLCFEQR